MRCPICKNDTKLLTTQTKTSTTHPLPIEFREIAVIRRRRVCLADDSHRFWTLEMSEDFWDRVLEERGIA